MAVRKVDVQDVDPHLLFYPVNAEKEDDILGDRDLSQNKDVVTVIVVKSYALDTVKNALVAQIVMEAIIVIVAKGVEKVRDYKVHPVLLALASSNAEVHY